MFFAKTYARIVIPSLTHPDPALPAASSHSIARAWQGIDRALDALITESGMKVDLFAQI